MVRNGCDFSISGGVWLPRQSNDSGRRNKDPSGHQLRLAAVQISVTIWVLFWLF